MAYSIEKGMAHIDSEPDNLLETLSELLVHMQFQVSDFGLRIEDCFANPDHASPFFLGWQTPQG